MAVDKQFELIEDFLTWTGKSISVEIVRLLTKPHISAVLALRLVGLIGCVKEISP